METDRIFMKIQARFPDGIESVVSDGMHPHVRVKPESLLDVCRYLKDDPELDFDLLRCISAVDWPQQERIELVYELLSIQYGHTVVLKVLSGRAEPEVDSVCPVWPAADWHEREAFDVMGVIFRNHPNLSRILMPEDWIGYPLRKDYQDLTEYHGLKIKP